MAVFTIQSPDGRKIKIEAADQATALRGAQEWSKANPAQVSGGMDALRGFGKGLAQGVAGLADTITQASPFGVFDSTMKTAAGLAERLQQSPGGQRMAAPYSGASDMAARLRGPQTGVGRSAQTLGQNIPNAIAPGGAAVRAVNVFAPTVGGIIAGETARASGANEGQEAVIRGLGGLAGAAAGSARPQNLFAPRGSAQPTDALATRVRADPAAMQQRATDMRAAGVQPTLIDVAGERGRRVIRAVGARSETAGETLQDAAATRSASTKPAAMAATRRLTADRRTPNVFADDLERTRNAQASQNYGQFDAEQIEIPDTVRDMLADSSGRSIIARARADAIENQDWGRQVELDRLLQPGAEGGVGPLPRISAGTVDRLVIAARERGAAFARRGNGNRARGAMQRRNQLDATLDNVEELRPARQTYSNQSRGIEVARGERLDPFSTDPGDYATWLSQLPPEAQQANQVALRQEILDTLGGQRSNTFGTLDQLASSEYARDNLRATFGPAADQYLAEINARLAQTRNATFVSPNAGSRTAVLENDVGNVQGMVEGARAVGRGLRGDVVGLVAQAADAWRRRGVSPQQAEELARIAVDPAQTDAAIQAIVARLQPQQRQEFFALRNAAITGAVAGSAAPRSSGVSR